MSARISLAGRIVAGVDGHRIDERALTRPQRRLVLAMLVSLRHRPVTRDELADNLWPWERPATWETALRGLVAQVRAFLVSAGLGDRDEVVRAVAGAYHLRLPPDLKVDIEEAADDVAFAERTLRAGEPAAARDLAAGARAVLSRPLLAGVDAPWLDDKRNELERLQLRGLELLAEARLALGEHPYAVAAAEEAVALDPFRETAYRLLMRAHQDAGEAAQALGAYERLRRLLADELGADPSPQTRALHASILRHGALVATVAAPARSVPPPDLGPEVCPYRGLQTFGEEDAPYFFGRSGDVARLLERLRPGRFLAVVGPSGSGKSSLVRAGLVPAVRRGGLPGSDTWPVLLLRPGVDPLKALAHELARLDPGVDEATVRRRLADDELALHAALEAVLDRHAGRGGALVVVDQLEEAFTLCGDDGDRRAFLDALVGAATAPRGRVAVVVTVRADLYPRLADHPRFADLASANQHLVTPMDEVGLAEAIRGPARAVGLTVEAGLTETILEDVARRPGSLPLLGHCLLELWDRRVDGVLTLDAYHAVGGVEGALAQRAEHVYGGLPAEQRPLARRVLLRLVQPTPQGEHLRRRAAWSELAGGAEEHKAVEAVLGQLIEARLVTGGGSPEQEPWVEVAHEALIHGWPRLREWAEQDRAGLVVHRRLTAAAREWERLDHDDGVLYRGGQLAEAAAWAERDPEAPNPLERQFLEASLAHDQAQRRRRVRRLRLVAASLAVGLTVVAVLAVTALVQRDRAQEQQRLALSRQIAAEAVVQLPSGPGLGLSLAVEAVRVAPTREAVAALRQALVTPTPRLELPGGRGDIALDPDGARLAVVQQSMSDRDGALWVWGLPSGDLAHLVERDVASATGAAFAPDGQLLLTTHQGAVRVWDVGDGSLVHDLDHGTGFPTASWSPDGRRVATAAGDDAVRVWDPSSGELVATHPTPEAVHIVRWAPDGRHLLAWNPTGPEVHVLEAVGGSRVARLAHAATVVDARIAPDGRLAATAGFDATARIWRLPDGGEVSVLDGFSDRVWVARFSPDGGLLLVGDDAGTVQLADAADGTTIAELRGHAAAVVDAAFSPDGSLAATASPDGTAMVWDVATGHRRAVLALGGGVSPDLGRSSVVFTPDGAHIVTRAAGVQVWDVPPGPDLVLAGHEQPVLALDVPPGGDLLASGARDGTLTVWDLSTGTATATMSVPDSRTTTVSFSPDGTRLVSANPFRVTLSDRDHPPIVWEVARGEPISTLSVPAPTQPPCPQVCQTAAVAFSPDGGSVLTAGQEGVPRLVDPDSGRVLLEFESAGRSLFSVAASPDSRWVAAAALDVVALWERADGGLVRLLDARGIDVAFAPDRDLLAVAGDDAVVTLWEPATGRLAGELRHTAAVTGVAWSADGRFLLTATNDGARLWDAASQQLIRTFDGPVGAVAFAPDDAMVLGRADGTVQIHRCTVCGGVDDLLDIAADRTLRELSALERQRFLEEADG